MSILKQPNLKPSARPQGKATPAGQRIDIIEPEKVGDKAPAQSVESLHQAAPAPAPVAAAPGPGVTIDGRKLTTKRDLALWYIQHILRLKRQQTEFQNDGANVPPSLQEAIDIAQKNLDGLTADGADGAAEVDIKAALFAQSWFDDKYTKALILAEREKARLAALSVHQYEEKMREAQRYLKEQLLPTLRDVQRAYFRSEKESDLLDISDKIATGIDTSLVLKNVLLDARACAAELENMTNVARGYRGVYVSANSMAPRIVELVEKANKVYAGFQLIRAGLDLSISNKTGVGKSIAAINAMPTVVSAGGTLLGASANLTVFSNLYLGPMVEECLSQLESLSDQISTTRNRSAIEVGRPDLVAWDNEPGGRPMFNFMLAVMRAGGLEGVPAAPKDVAKYFVDNAEDLSAGARGYEQLPTQGFWPFKELDQARIAAWVFYNRDNIWGMLYGATKPPIYSP